MAKKFRALVNETMSPESQARAGARTKVMLQEMHMAELRRARELSQADLAEKLGTTQPKVSDMEHRTDMYLSTMRRYVEAMGGELDLIAKFPDSNVRIRQFKDLEHA